MPKVILMFVTDVPTKILIFYIFSSGVNIWPITDSVKTLMHTLLCTLFSTREFIWQNLHFIIFIYLGLSRIFTTKHQLLLHFTSSCLCHVPTNYNESDTKRFKKCSSQIIVTTFLWIKKKFQNKKAQVQKTWKPHEREFMFHKQQNGNKNRKWRVRNDRSTIEGTNMNLKLVYNICNIKHTIDYLENILSF